MSINQRLINTGGAAEYTLFDSLVYTGSTSSVDLNLTPGLLYVKGDSASQEGLIYDTSRGNDKALFPSENYVESSSYALTLRDGGFNPGNAYNGTASQDYIAYAWKAGGAPVTNTNGGITSQVSANVEGGFSIVQYSGACNQSNVGHGLSSPPEAIIFKNISNTTPLNWAVFQNPPGNSKYIYWNTTGYFQDPPNNTSWWRFINPTSTVFTVGGNPEINCGGSIIAYCWHSVPGISKIGGYVYTDSVGYSNRIITGFKPKMVMVKNWNSYNDFIIYDSSTSSTDSVTTYIRSTTKSAFETNTTNEINFESDGFWFTNSGTPASTLGYQYYMAFADESV